VLYAYSLGIVGSRKIERLCRTHAVCIALACGQCPDHSTIAAFVSSLHEEIVPLFCEILGVCEEQQLLGGTVFALDGIKLPSNAFKQWGGTREELTQKQEKLEAKITQLIAEHQDVDTRKPRGATRPAKVRRTLKPPNDARRADAPHPKVVQEKDLQCDHMKEKDGQHGTLLKTEGQSLSESLHHPCQSNSLVTGQQSEPPRWAERLQRLRRQAARLKEWLATHGPKIGKQGKEVKSNVTDHDSAKMATSHGVI
jgi:hypothetical protein